MYTGLIYNDIFSKGLELFPEGWHFEKDGSSDRWIGHRQTYDDGTPITYAFGVDPVRIMITNYFSFLQISS